jgi:adenosylmethionine-8-amino-7-oxononanoate aminotransferase
MHRLAKLDHQYIWHPFTQMRDWLKREPIVIAEGHGAVLRDVKGREYLDANSSIWTNLHGHNHPHINRALQRQLKKVAHVSALGLANEPASLLSEELVKSADSHLNKVFFSDDGATAMEVSLKLAYEFSRRVRDNPRPKFLSLEGGYHGDTVGAAALGQIARFRQACSGLLFKTDKVMAPYCYRCPFNRAKPERADARDYRKCNWECTGKLEEKFAAQKRKGAPYAGFVFEPMMQGAAGMIAQPAGWLRRAVEIARAHDALLIADEVMTGFGRTGVGCRRRGNESLTSPPPLFACQHEKVQPDFLNLAKGLSGGYLPFAATLTTQQVFDAFLGEYEEFKTFFHGHSFTANPLGAAAALASLELLQRPASIRARGQLETLLSKELATLWKHPHVGDIRQVGLVAGIELVKNWRTREPFDIRARAGQRVSEAMARRGVLTRPIGDVVVLMPPYCTTAKQVRRIIQALHEAVAELE